MAQLAQAAELLVEVLLQAAVEPADEQAEGLAGVAHDERLPILGADSARVELPFQKGLHHVAAQLHQMLLVHVAAGGRVPGHGAEEPAGQRAEGGDEGGVRRSASRCIC